MAALEDGDPARLQLIGDLSDALGAPLLIADPELVVLHCNSAFIRLHALAPHLELGIPLIEAMPQLKDTDLWQAIQASRGTRNVKTLPPAISTMYIETTVVSGPWGIALLHKDASQARQLEELQWEFLDGLAHAFQTPLTSIGGYAETLMNSAPEPDLVREFLQRIHSQSQRLSKLVDDLLYIARVGRLKAPDAKELVDFKRVAREACLACQPAAECKGVGLDLVMCQEPLFVMGNREALLDMASNLLDNAIKYSSFGGEVEAKICHEADEAVLIVRDNGVGIRADEQHRVFTRFFRGDAARSGSYPGAGLGLSKVLSIVEAHSGTIELESAPSAGTTFTVRLPSAAQAQ